MTEQKKPTVGSILLENMEKRLEGPYKFGKGCNALIGFFTDLIALSLVSLLQYFHKKKLKYTYGGIKMGDEYWGPNHPDIMYTPESMDPVHLIRDENGKVIGSRPLTELELKAVRNEL